MINVRFAVQIVHRIAWPNILDASTYPSKLCNFFKGFPVMPARTNKSILVLFQNTDWHSNQISFMTYEYTLSIITSQLHCFQLRTTLNGKDFKFFSHGLCTEKQNILLQHMHEKEFFILTNKCGNKL